MDIRKQLRQIRKGKEISARQMAIETKTSVNTIQACENLRMFPNLKYLLKIADYLGYEIKIVRKQKPEGEL